MGAWARSIDSEDHFTDVEKYTGFAAELPFDPGYGLR
jgi:hypothetical protein